MNDSALLLLLPVVVVALVVQTVMSLRQAKSFTRAVTALRRKGTVAVGVGGRRYRGGRAYVALVTEGSGTVVDALVIRGFTTLARARPLSSVRGVRLARLCSAGDIAGLRANEREAARQAAQTLRRPPAPARP